MKKRLFTYTSLVTIIMILSVFILSVMITHRNNINIAKDAVIESAYILADIYMDNNDLDYLIQIGEMTRVTIISSSGEVIKDSKSLSNPENHINRPEIIAALNGEPSVYIRSSDSLGGSLIYYALKVETNDDYIFIRTAIPIETINAYLKDSLPILILILIVAIVICFFITRAIINRLIKPFDALEERLRNLAYGGYDDSPLPGRYPEIDDISRELKEISIIINSSIDSYRNEKEKAEYILSNISEGLIIVNNQSRIQFINAAALNIFNVVSDITGEHLNYITYNNNIGHAVRECHSSNTNAVFELQLKGRTYFVLVKRLSNSDFVMVTLTDVNEIKENSRRREEFFANASHELKTPLTAIKGFNELTLLYNKDVSIEKYINSISHETDRMLSLIGDMLKLSELETSSSLPLDSVDVSLADVVSEVVGSLHSLIIEKELSVNILGDSIVNAKSEHLYELIKNIIENAVRYNKQNGNISIVIESEGNRSWVFIHDTGIGISSEEQSRIFERFYRVEKSRSARNGGTGLGLSIVKHICSIYGWNLTLKSTLGLGTEVTISF